YVHADILDVATHCSCLLGGKVIRVNAYFPPKVKCHSPADLPMLCCSPFAPAPPPHFLPRPAVGEGPPAQRSAAEAAPLQLRPWKAGRSFIMHYPRRRGPPGPSLTKLQIFPA